jgi:hypothetical protein
MDANDIASIIAKTTENGRWRVIVASELIEILADYFDHNARSTAPHLCDCDLNYYQCYLEEHQFNRQNFMKLVKGA